VDGLGGVHVAAGGVLEAESGAVEEGDGACAPGKDVVVDGVVEMDCVLHDWDEGVLDVLLSVAVVGGECGCETVDEGGPVCGGGVVVAVEGSAGAAEEGRGYSLRRAIQEACSSQP